MDSAGFLGRYSTPDQKTILLIWPPNFPMVFLALDVIICGQTPYETRLSSSYITVWQILAVKGKFPSPSQGFCWECLRNSHITLLRSRVAGKASSTVFRPGRCLRLSIPLGSKAYSPFHLGARFKVYGLSGNELLMMTPHPHLQSTNKSLRYVYTWGLFCLVGV